MVDVKVFLTKGGAIAHGVIFGFRLEKEAGHAGASTHKGRGQGLAFELHGAASVRKALVPRDIVVLALVAVDIG